MHETLCLSIKMYEKHVLPPLIMIASKWRRLRGLAEPPLGERVAQSVDAVDREEGDPRSFGSFEGERALSLDLAPQRVPQAVSKSHCDCVPRSA